ncbi:MAG: hypothetical protein H6741_31785 [Alphaproteobacteria bacterium]|nr:hypothetical protein [Alphaproteobacteria bacterium]
MINALLGTRLSLLMGKTVPRPPAPDVTRALRSVTVSNPLSGRSTFSLSFRAERARSNPFDYGLIGSFGAMPGVRVVLSVFVGPMPAVLMDGVITSISLQPGAGPGNPDTYTVQGEDLTYLMDLEEESKQHVIPLLSGQVLAVLAPYARHGILPQVIPMVPPVVFNPLKQINQQHETDYAFLSRMAREHGYLFKLIPGPAPCVSRAFWGPESMLKAGLGGGLPQRALSVNLGPMTNIQDISFSLDGPEVVEVKGQLLRKQKVSGAPSRTLPLARKPASKILGGMVRKVFDEELSQATNSAEARGKAKAKASASQRGAVTAQGTLNAVDYGGVLKPASLVGVRGAGMSFDGMYLVEQVTHKIQEGSYTQSFSLRREGLGTTVPVVIP